MGRLAMPPGRRSRSSSRPCTGSSASASASTSATCSRACGRSLIAGSILSTTVLPSWLGIVGIVVGIALLVGTLEFVGPNERDGWALAGTIVPIAYIAWSVWLIALGVFLLI